MTTPSYLLGIDLGTSSVKAALFEAERWRVVKTAGREYPVHHPRPGFAQQEPDAWWQAVVQATRAVLGGVEPGRVKGIGLDGQMHGLVCLGASNEPVWPAIIWADTRAGAQVKELAAFQDGCEATLPGPPAAGFAAASALWLSRHRPNVLEQTRMVMCPKDYVRFQLTGQVGTDPSDAAGTWLFDIAADAWSPEVVTRCGLRPEQMPPVKPSGAVFGPLTAQAGRALGLPAGIPVVTGSADLPAQALGHGIINPGEILVTVGTGGQVFSPRLAPRPDPERRLYVFQHNVPGRWYAQAAILSGGLSLRWLRNLLGLQEHPDAYAHLSTLAAGIPAGAEGLLFLPYLAGERTPHMDANAAGLFLGLRLHHQAAHLARAVMEGVGFALKDCLALVSAGPASITLSGGVTRSKIWPQILADIWARPVRVPTREVPRACLGAAILAGVGSGIYSDVSEALAGYSEPVAEIQPAQVDIYAGRYRQYQSLYGLLKDEMHQLQSGKG